MTQRACMTRKRRVGRPAGGGVPPVDQPVVPGPGDDHLAAGQPRRGDVPDGERLLGGRRWVGGAPDSTSNRAIPSSPAATKMARPSGTAAAAAAHPYGQTGHGRPGSATSSPVAASNRRASPCRSATRMTRPPGTATGQTRMGPAAAGNAPRMRRPLDGQRAGDLADRVPPSARGPVLLIFPRRSGGDRLRR